MSDGARLHGYCYTEGRRSQGSDLVCLPQIPGSNKEFHEFALQALASPDSPGRIFMFDLRGRGLSIDVTSSGLSYGTDADDFLSFCDALGLHHFDMLASGRSALTVLLTAPKRPGFIRKLVLNDGAPLFDGVGIARSKTAAQRAAHPSSWEDAPEALRKLKGDEFPGLTETDWQEMARMEWRDVDGHPSSNLDKALKQDIASTDFDDEQPDLWPEWRILADKPVLLVRGEHSSMVTLDIEKRMREQHANLGVEVVLGQGHVPLLHLQGLAGKVTAFLGSNEVE